jgi:hypothetical protein
VNFLKAQRARADEGNRERVMISALGSAASGMRDALVRLDVAAENVANVNTPDFQPARVISVAQPEGGVRPVVLPADSPLAMGGDLLGGLVDLIVARGAFAANAASFRAAAHTERSLLSVLG